MSYFTLNLAKRVMGTFKIFQYVKLLLKNKRRSASRNEKSSFRALRSTLNWPLVFGSGLIIRIELNLLTSCLPKSRTLFNKAINPQKVVFLNRSHWADSKITHTGHEDKLLKKLQPNKNFLRIIVPQSEPEFIDQTNNLLILYVKIYKVVNGKNWLKFRNFCLFSMDMLAKRPFLPDWSINSGGQ